jgi:hypothetical protein
MVFSGDAKDVSEERRSCRITVCRMPLRGKQGKRDVGNGSIIVVAEVAKIMVWNHE